MTDQKIDRRIAAAGFGALAVILALELFALYRLEVGVIHFRSPRTEWSETVMRLMFGHSR